MMIVVAWVIHCLVLSGVLTAAAFVWERAARVSGLSVRWGWLVALAGSVSLPWLLRIVPEREWAESLPAGLPVVRLDPLVSVPAGVEAQTSWSVVGVGAGVWVVLSAAAVIVLAQLLWRLERARATWRSADVDGVSVLVSPDVGPAALGFTRSAVVVPSWVLSLDRELRTLLLQHEREHVRAGDPRLLLAALVLLALMPWNPFVWLQVARLRNGLELDCDARVLRSGASPRRYGTLLLEVGRRRSTSTLVMATFAEPRMFLEERIRRITRWPAQRRPLAAVALGILALVIGATSLSARDPFSARALPDALPTVVLPGLMPADTPPKPRQPLPTLREIEDAPTFTPMTTRPELLNTDDVVRELNRAYPPLLRDAGIGGAPFVWFLVSDDGTVVRTLLSKTGGHAALDSAALRVGRMMRFSPARYGDQRVPVWVEIPVVFGPPPPGTVPVAPTPAAAPLPPAPAPAPQPAATPAPAPAAPPAPAPAPSVAPRPGVPITPAAPVRAGTPVASVPTLVNPREVQSALISNYPPLLRDAGITGTAVLSLHVNAEGDVARAQVSVSSGRVELDEAALRVAAVMRFSPAAEQGSGVPVWVEVPVVFGSTVRPRVMPADSGDS